MNLGKVLAGIGVLIGMYLVISNGANSTKIIQTIASNSVSGIKTLQGR
jgi:hypothetical protein